ncbi:hypothetical protein BD779DRAFT_498709 [Infundibulicybe gibba]|nr:hypothetical protein BD779DRAFT_498709 [Infundibulicybe gibba]
MHRVPNPPYSGHHPRPAPNLLHLPQHPHPMPSLPYTRAPRRRHPALNFLLTRHFRPVPSPPCLHSTKPATPSAEEPAAGCRASLSASVLLQHPCLPPNLFLSLYPIAPALRGRRRLAVVERDFTALHGM